jgi:hypothetical protein
VTAALVRRLDQVLIPDVGLLLVSGLPVDRIRANR